MCYTWQLLVLKELTKLPGFSRFILDYTQAKGPEKENLEKDLSH